jgi:hypothetical protein
VVTGSDYSTGVWRPQTESATRSCSRSYHSRIDEDDRHFNDACGKWGSPGVGFVRYALSFRTVYAIIPNGRGVWKSHWTEASYDGSGT